MALGSTYPPIEMSIRNIPLGGKGCRCLGLTSLPPSCADCFEILGVSTTWNPQGMSRFVMGLLYEFNSMNYSSSWDANSFSGN